MVIMITLEHVRHGALDPAVAAHLAYMRHRGQSARTIYQRERSLTRLEAHIPRPLTEATREDLLDWRAAMRCGAEGVKHYVTDAHMFYCWLRDVAGLRPDNPADNIPVPRPPRRLPRPVGERELFRALAAAPRRIRPMLVLAGWAGLRAKEIAYLRRRYVMDTLRPPYILVADEAAKGGHERVVPIGGFVLEELLAYGLPRPADAWVFPRHDGQAGPNMPHRISALANGYLAGLGIDATLHQLRHRFASQVHEHTGDIRMVQELLGHKDLRTTQIYAAISPARAAAAIARLPAPGRIRLMPAGEQ